MISRYDIRNYANKYPDKCWFKIKDDSCDVMMKETGEYFCHIDDLVLALRKRCHCDFECLFSGDLGLQTILRCRECGTVIFSYDDYRYDVNLKCPTCSDYKTSFEFWTKEEIEADEDKQKALKFFADVRQSMIEESERRKRRGGKYDWQIASYMFRWKKHGLSIELQCDNLFKYKLKGLKLKLIWLEKQDNSYIYKKTIWIPLSISYLKVLIRIHKKSKVIE